MGRTEIFDEKKLIRFTSEMIERIERWGKKQKPPLNFSDSARALIEAGLSKGK